MCHFFSLLCRLSVRPHAALRQQFGLKVHFTNSWSPKGSELVILNCFGNVGSFPMCLKANDVLNVSVSLAVCLSRGLYAILIHITPHMGNAIGGSVAIYATLKCCAYIKSGTEMLLISLRKERRPIIVPTEGFPEL